MVLERTAISCNERIAITVQQHVLTFDRRWFCPILCPEFLAFGQIVRYQSVLSSLYPVSGSMLLVNVVQQETHTLAKQHEMTPEKAGKPNDGSRRDFTILEGDTLPTSTIKKLAANEKNKLWVANKQTR